MNKPKQSIFKYVSTDEEGRHFIYPDKFLALLNDEDFKDELIKTKIQGHQFPNNLKPLIVLKKGRGVGYNVMNYETSPPKNPTLFYTHPQKEAIYKYRKKNVAKYNDYNLKQYHKNMNDPEWRENRNEKAKEYNSAYRKRKRDLKPKKEIKINLLKGLVPLGRPFGSFKEQNKTKEQYIKEFEVFKNKHFEKLKAKDKLNEENTILLEKYFKDKVSELLTKT